MQVFDNFQTVHWQDCWPVAQWCHSFVGHLLFLRIDVLEWPCLRQNDSGSTLLVVYGCKSRHFETVTIEPQWNWLILVDGFSLEGILFGDPHSGRIHCQASCGWLIGDPHESKCSIPRIHLSHKWLIILVTSSEMHCHTMTFLGQFCSPTFSVSCFNLRFIHHC